MDNRERRGAENDALFDTMLKSILKPPSDLQKNWDVNLIKLCDRFLQKIRRAMQEGCSYIDFVEAAMVVQSSTAVYARKVDYLWVLLEKLLVTFRSNPTDNQEPRPEGQESAPKRGRRVARSLVAEDYSDVTLDLPVGRGINLRPSKNYTVEEFEEADYFIQDLMNNKETGLPMPLIDVHGEMIGNMHDFRMNRLLVDGMWLADSLPVFELRGQRNRFSVLGNDEQEEADEGELLFPTGDGSPWEPALEPQQETGAEVQVRPPSPDKRAPTPLPSSSRPSSPSPHSPGQGSDVEISRAAQTRSATRGLNVVDAVLVSKDELSRSCKADIPDKPLVVNVSIRPECIYCHERHERKSKKECCKSEEQIQCCLSGIEAMLLDDVIKPELTKLGGFQFNRDFLLGLRKSQIRSIQEPACLADWTTCTLTNLKRLFEDDEVGEFRGFDLSLCEELLQQNSAEELQPNADDGDELDTEDVGASELVSQEIVPLPVDIACERDNINTRLEASSPVPERQPYFSQLESAARDVEERESRAARVMAWHDSVRPLLVGAEKRSNVDINDYGSELLAAFPPGRTRCTLSFQQVVQDKPQEDTCCYFLAALILANARNVDISKSDDSELAMDCMELTLLDRSLRHEIMEDQCVSITTSDRSRKRKKTTAAVDRMAQPQNDLAETPLRESPNRINIMSKGSVFQVRTTVPQAGPSRLVAPGPSYLSAPGPSRFPSDPQPGPSWASDVNDWSSDTSDSVDLSDVRTLGACTSKRRKVKR